MGGLAYFFIVGLYVAAVIFVVKRIPMRWGKALTAVVFLLIPTADAIYGRIKLQQLCEADGGLKVFRKASKEGGLMMSTPTPEDYWIRTIGIDFIEGTAASNGRYARVSIMDGKPFLELDVIPKSRYRLSEHSPLTRPLGDNYVGDEIRIEDQTSGEVFSQYREYGFKGGWAERFMGRFADSGPQGGSSCPPTTNRLDLLIQNTFN